MNESEHKSRKQFSIPGAVITAIMFLISAVYCVNLTKTQLLPFKFLLPIYIIIFGVLLIIGLLIIPKRKRRYFWIGIAICGLMVILLVYSGFMVLQGVRTLNAITSEQTEVAHIGIYVAADDSAQDLSSLREDTFGILAELDRESVDHSIEKVNTDLQTEITIAEYDGLSELINGLFTQEIRAIILNDAYLDILEEMEEYTNIQSSLREITQLQIESTPANAEPSQATQTETPAVQTIPQNDHTFTVFISGIDTRGSLATKGRSDVNILAVINTDTRQVLLVSTPRDFFVPLSISNGVPDKLTNAGIYGVNVSMDTIGMLYGIDIDYYFRVNFTGFEDIINSLGGVTVYSEYTFDAGGYHYEKGENYLNGSQALAFARERHSFATGDRQRGKNQMAVIRGVINKALSPDMLTHYTSLLSAVEGSFSTSVPYDLISSVVRNQLNNGGAWNIVTYSVNGTDDNRRPYSQSTRAYVMIPDQSTVNTAKTLIKQVFNDETIKAP